jgi:tetratricopeptide (TPR) repeat protein
MFVGARGRKEGPRITRIFADEIKFQRPLQRLEKANPDPRNSRNPRFIFSSEFFMTFRFHISAAVIAAVALHGTEQPAWAQQLDQVFLTKGAPSRGMVSAMTRDQVTQQVGGAARQIAANEVARITYSDEPAELNAARTAVLQRNYSGALQELKKLEGATIQREFARHDFEYYKALCQARLAMTEGGDKSAATAAMLDFVRAAPQSYHFYEAAETLGDLSMASGKYADAAKYYGPAGVAGAPWPEYQLRGNNAVGRALAAEKIFDQALARFEAVIASELTTAEATSQKLLATVGKAICLAEMGQAEAAVALLQDLIAKNDPQDQALFARAYNALGQCHLKLNKPKEALLAYLHTDVLFYNDADAHAEALYHLTRLWTDANKSDRALAARTTLKERYAGSIWATLE